MRSSPLTRNGKKDASPSFPTEDEKAHIQLLKNDELSPLDNSLNVLELFKDFGVARKSCTKPKHRAESRYLKLCHFTLK